MEFRFDAAQQFQLDAIAAVTGLLEGQSHIGATLLPSAGSTVVPNGLELTEAQLLENLNRVQTENSIPTDAALGHRLIKRIQILAAASLTRAR